jgi:ribosomal protein L24E
MRPFRPQVIKTEQCSFSEFRIWPGHGMRYARRDGTVSASAVEHLRRECI